MASGQTIDWYEHRDELRSGQVFMTADGPVRLDRRKPGDGTKWVVETWYPRVPFCVSPGLKQGCWIGDEDTIEPGDLIERLPEMEAA